MWYTWCTSESLKKEIKWGYIRTNNLRIVIYVFTLVVPFLNLDYYAIELFGLIEGLTAAAAEKSECQEFSGFFIGKGDRTLNSATYLKNNSAKDCLGNKERQNACVTQRIRKNVITIISVRLIRKKGLYNWNKYVNILLTYKSQFPDWPLAECSHLATPVE